MSTEPSAPVDGAPEAAENADYQRPAEAAPGGRPEVTIYAWGLVMMSVCAPANMDASAVEDSANRQHPTGIRSEWRVSEKPFRGTEQTSPIPCHDSPDQRHWLLSC